MPSRTTESGSPIRLVVCDDDSAFRFLVRNWLRLEPAFEIVAEVGDVIELVPAVAACRPDVVIVDGGSRPESARDPVADVRRIHPAARVLVVSGMPAWTLKELIAITRADGGVSKSEGMDALVDAIRRIAAADKGR